MTDEIVRYESESFMPVMAIAQAVERRNALVGFVKSLMVEGQDYGKIPGTDKPTLLKAGAEKLATYFGFSPVFVPERITEDFGDAGNEPLFFYRYRCELYRKGVLMGAGIGSCNSREAKYRWRNADRACPNCGKAAITKSKYPPRNQPNAEPGWYCYTKKGGCGAEFGATDSRITSQVGGRAPNPDIADVVNTIDKMAQKRALIAATLISVNASEFFTQDVEDMVIDAEWAPVPAPQSQPQTQRPSTPAPVQPPVTSVTEPIDNPFNGNGNGTQPAEDNLITEKQLKMLHAVGVAVYGDGWKTKRGELVEAVTRGERHSAADLTKAEAKTLIDGLVKKQAALQSAPSAGELAAVPEMAH